MGLLTSSATIIGADNAFAQNLTNNIDKLVDANGNFVQQAALCREFLGTLYG